MILYEYPFNERIRTSLRLEHLFDRFDTLAARESAIDHHYALLTVFELVDVSARSDLKTEVMRDLERQRQQLAALRDNPAVAQDMLDQIMGRIDDCFQALEAQSGKPGQSILDNDWLTSIRSRASIPAGTCSFDLPAYHAWQQLPAAERQSALRAWTQPLVPLSQAIKLLLTLMRESGQTQRLTAQRGVFQQALPPGKTFQLLRVAMAAPGVIPEISANRLLVSIRMQQQADGLPVPIAADTDFALTLCA